MGNDNLFDDLLNDDSLEIELSSEVEAKIDNVFDDMPSLNDRALLSILKRRDTRMSSAYDEATQEELRDTIGDNSLTATKKLFRNPDSLVRQIVRLSNQLYRYHNTHTLESGTIGERVLDLTPRKGEHVLIEFQREINERIDKINERVQRELLPNWDALVQADIDYRSEIARADLDPVRRQQKLSRITVDEYPDAGEMVAQFNVVWDIKPIAEESAINRLTRGPQAILDKARSDIAKVVADVQGAARRDLSKRMLDPINKALEKLNKPIGEKGSIFRDSLIDNLKEQLDMVTELCIVDDDDTHKAIAKAKTVIEGSMPGHEALRTSQDARSKAVDQLNDLVGVFNGLQ